MTGVMNTGYVLPNGATVLEASNHVVLARHVHSHGVEYVTWRWDGKDPASTWSGNYWRSIANAAKDFELRVNKYERGIYANG